jgi:hypothetical protein
VTFFQRYKYFCFSYNKDILINVRTFRYKCYQSRDVIYPVLKGYNISRLITYNIASLSVSIKPVPAVNQLNQLFPIGPRAGVIYSWLLKYTLQHTTGVTENNWGPHLLKPVLYKTRFTCITESIALFYMYYREYCSCFTCITESIAPVLHVLQRVLLLFYMYYREYCPCFTCITESIAPVLHVLQRVLPLFYIYYREYCPCLFLFL